MTSVMTRALCDEKEKQWKNSSFMKVLEENGNAAFGAAIRERSQTTFSLF